MAVHLQSSFILPGKFDKLSFSDYESLDSMSTDASSTPSTPQTPQSPLFDISIQIITRDDHDKVLNFLQEFFFRDEPLNTNLELLTDEQPRCIELEEFCTKDLNNGINLKAMYDGKIVGVCLNGILERDCTEESGPMNCESKKFAKILGLLDYVGRESNVFSHFADCDKGMTVKIISVNAAYRGKGIAKELMSKTRDLAKEHGCGFMSVDCSSHFTAMALKKLGFECVYTLKYADYLVDGEVVFEPEAPHAACTVYAQKVE